MPRGGGLNEPTLAEVKRPAIALPPSRRRIEASTSIEAKGPRKSGFLTFLLAMLVVAGLLALIGWQAAPWLLKQTVHRTDSEPSASATPPALTPAPAAAAPGETKPPDSKAPDTTPAEAKPSPMPAVHQGETKAAGTDTDAPSKAPRKNRNAVQPVTIISSPGGATATFDGNPETACITPCSIEATPGRHNLAIKMEGYQLERREVDVGSGPQELPAVILQANGGTVWLTSVPSGAAVLVNGKRISQVTPAQIPLGPGTYKITVEKDGKQANRTVDVHSGITYLKVLFDQ
jgi:hypothetical protein